MKVLVACEESQTVCKAFRGKGHEAYCCDECREAQRYAREQERQKNANTVANTVGTPKTRPGLQLSLSKTEPQER